MLFTSIFSFLHNIFKSCHYHSHKSWDCVLKSSDKNVVCKWHYVTLSWEWRRKTRLQEKKKITTFSPLSTISCTVSIKRGNIVILKKLSIWASIIFFLLVIYRVWPRSYNFSCIHANLHVSHTSVEHIHWHQSWPGPLLYLQTSLHVVLYVHSRWDQIYDRGSPWYETCRRHINHCLSFHWQWKKKNKRGKLL